MAKPAMTFRERFHTLMNFQPVDRLPIMEWAGWWDQTLDRWHAEGLPAGLDNQGIMRHLGLDIHYQDWLGPRWNRCPPPRHHGAPMVKTDEDYETIRSLLFPTTGPFIDTAKWQSWARRQREQGELLWFTLNGFFWFPRSAFGIENHLYAFYDQPELMHRMNADLAAFNLRLIDELCAICRPDFMTFAEDMSYNNGPMLSEEQFNEFLLPYYGEVVPRLRGEGIRVFVDSDGDITRPAAWFERAGIEGILPLERQAGVDLAVLRQQHPGQLYIGAYDKMVMPRGEAAMRAEFERLLPVAQQGGFAISVDHQTPPGVSLEHYRLYLRLFQEYARAL